MKLHLKNPSKKVILVASVAALGVIGGVSAQLADKPKVSAGSSPLVQEVANQGTELDNHEARIGNTENDVKDLQGKTNTPPSTVRVPVPVVISSPTNNTTAPVEQSAPVVTVTGYKEIVIDPDTSDCEYTYSDGTTNTFHWKTTNPQGAWTTNGVGGNGHWEKTTDKIGFCDIRAVGTVKS